MIEFLIELQSNVDFAGSIHHGNLGPGVVMPEGGQAGFSGEPFSGDALLQMQILPVSEPH